MNTNHYKKRYIKAVKRCIELGVDKEPSLNTPNGLYLRLMITGTAIGIALGEPKEFMNNLILLTAHELNLPINKIEAMANVEISGQLLRKAMAIEASRK